MNVRKKIKRLGIEKISEVDESIKIKLADMISSKLTENFKNSKLNKEQIERKLVNTNMYLANMPKTMSKVNYIYIDSSIYFDKNLNLEELDEAILHECIHKIQEYKDKKNRLIQLGMCNFTDTKIIGLAFNEAAIQYIVSKILHNEKKNIQIYGIHMPTISRNYYAMVTNLIEQIVYLIGEETLVDSTINCNDEFIYECIDNFGEKNFYEIRDNFDKILSLRDNISKLLIQYKEKEKIKNYIEELQRIYFSTQELVITSYFETLLNMINSLQEVEEYKKKLSNYFNLIGKIEGYNFFDKYYAAQYEKILLKEERIKSKTALIVVNNNPILKAFRVIKKLFIKTGSEYK